MPFNDKRKNGEEEEEDASNRASSFASSMYKDDDKAELKKTNFKTSLTLVVDDSQTTNRKQKERPTRADYSLLLSGLYALVLILIGLLFPLSDALQDNWLETEYVTVFLVYIYVLSTVFLIYVQGHIWYNSYKAHHGGGGRTHGHLSSHGSSSSSNSTVKVNSSNNNALTVTPPHGTGDADKARRNRAKHRSMTAMVRYSSSVNLGSKEAERDFGGDYGQESFGEEVDEEFEMWIDMTKLGGIFSHEGSSFYLRLGALFFGIGHLIYVCLELENNTHIPASCGINIFWWTYIIRLIFIVVQTFFLFKNQSVHVTKMKILARFGFAHLIATNFCIWLRTLINEISHEYHHLADVSHTDALANYTTSPGAPAAHLLPIHSIVKRATADGCSYYRGILLSASIYLFPFVLEYSLIAMGMFAIIYYSIDEHSKDGVIKGLANFFKVQRMDLSGVEKDEGHGHGDEGHGGHHGPSVFQKSHSGIFAGIILLAACIVSIILFFFTMDTQQDIVAAELIYLTSDLVLHSLLLVASVAAIVQVNRLSYIAKPVSIDDMLLYLSMAGTLILEIAITIASGNRLSTGSGSTGIASPALKSNEILRLCSSMVAAIQTIAQVVVAMSGMRRYPSKASHLSDMPGRNFVTFLVIGNVSVWIFRTLQAKELSLHDTQRGFYGDLAWLLLMNINLPLLLFYRFHSSICLADVWMVAYEPLHQKVQKPPQEHGTQSHSAHAGDFPSNSIIRSVSVPQLYRQVSAGGKRVGNGVESNGRAVFELDGISRNGSASSLNMAHRF